MKTVKVKTSELEGAALDWVVAQTVKNDRVYTMDGGVVYDQFIEEHGDLFPVDYAPSANWSQCGPLIEEYEITIYPPRHLIESADRWGAQYYIVNQPNILRGSTPLIAACRAIVASVNGEYVEVPEELCQDQ